MEALYLGGCVSSTSWPIVLWTFPKKKKKTGHWNNALFARHSFWCLRSRNFHAELNRTSKRPRVFGGEFKGGVERDHFCCHSFVPHTQHIHAIGSETVRVQNRYSHSAILWQSKRKHGRKKTLICFKGMKLFIRSGKLTNARIQSVLHRQWRPGAGFRTEQEQCVV